ncbi:MAG: class I SAM-dependent methyltransferase [Anaerolineae bacterium]
MHDDPLYRSTQQAWESIWDDASVETELATLAYPRTDYMAEFQRHLPRDGVILEAGCGLGIMVIHLRREGFNVVGLDYVETAVRKALAYDSTLPLQVGDVHALPYARDSLAAYLSFGVLEHFPQGPVPALCEAHRALRPGGVLVLTIPYPNVVHRLVSLRRRLTGQVERSDAHFYESTYTRRQLEDAVRQAGFEVACSRPTGHSFTWWGLGGPFRAAGYYRTSPLAEWLGRLTRAALPWAFNFMTLVIARKPAN